MREMSQAARGVNWLITDFVNNVPGVAHTVVVSADGLPLAFSEGFPKDRITGVYDGPTEARIRELQDSSTLAVTGVVDAATWDLFQRRACDLYDF